MSQYRVRLFGSPSITRDNEIIRFERRKALALLAYLLFDSGTSDSQSRKINRENLKLIFWPDCSSDQAGAYLRHALWEISHLLGEQALVKDGQAIAVNSNCNLWLDVRSFAGLVKPGRDCSEGADQAIQQLNQAVEYYTADFMSGFSLPDCPDFDDWQLNQANALRQIFFSALEKLTILHIQKGDFESAAQSARRWVEKDPLCVPAQQFLIKIYGQSGRITDALRQFETYRSALQKDIGIEPEEEIAGLIEQIKAGNRNFWDLTSSAQGDNFEDGKQTPARPSGTIAFLFTDIEGSTRLWERHPQAMKAGFSRQEEIVRAVISNYQGYIYKMIGDAFQIAFSTGYDAIQAAVAAQRALGAENWGEIGDLRVRMAIHCGSVEEREDDYVGPTLNRVARILSSGYGGQILINQPVFELVRDRMTPSISFKDLGEYVLKDLIHPEHIYQVLAPDLQEDFPPLLASTPSHRLPVQSTSFVGREKELAYIQALLSQADCRMINLLGIGGTGKTRLAIQAASLCTQFAQGACFVGLADASTFLDLVMSTAQAAGLTFYTQPNERISVEYAQEQLFNFLAPKSLLLIVDNFEHLTSYSSFLAHLLETAPHIKMIVTSRERLNLSGEWVLEVRGLPFPEGIRGEIFPGYPAVQLFLKGAERIGGRMPVPDDYEAIARICKLLEGLPLGIEMAAGWTKILSCQEIADELEKDLDFLSSGVQSQKSLRTVFDRSWQLLADSEQAVLANLAIFQGGFTREAALKVAGASVVDLASFVDKSFLRRIARGRFELQPVLHPYVVGQFNLLSEEAKEIQRAHADYYFTWLVESDRRLKGSDQPAVLNTLREDMQNLLSAWEFMISQRDIDRLQLLLPAVILFDVMNDQPVIQPAFDRLLLSMASILEEIDVSAVSGESTKGLLALVYASLYFFDFRLLREGAYTYQRRCNELIEALPDSKLKADCMILNSFAQGSLTKREAIEYALRAAAIYQTFGDPWGYALGLTSGADGLYFGCQEAEEAKMHYMEALSIFSRLGNPWGKAVCCTGLAYVEKHLQNLNVAEEMGREALAIFKNMGNGMRILSVNAVLGDIALARCRYAEAAEYYEANQAFCLEHGEVLLAKQIETTLRAIESKNPCPK